VRRGAAAGTALQQQQRRWRFSGPVSRAQLGKKKRNIGEQTASIQTSSTDQAAGAADSNAENVFTYDAPGLGAAVIHSHYDRLGHFVQVPDFLNEPKTCAIIGAPMSWGQPRAGTDQGSIILRNCGLEGTLLGLEWRVDDMGDLEFDPPSRTDKKLKDGPIKGKAKNSFCVGQGLKKIHDEVYKATKKGEFPLILGGDHSISAGTVSAILRARPDTGIIWVDAHGDLNTPESSPSGNMHGMPLGLLMGLVDPTKIPGWEWFADVPKLKPEQLVFVGLRDLDSMERDVIIEKNIKAFTMFDVDRFGIGKVMDMATEHLKGRPLHLSYDIDAVDPELAPATGTVVRGGFNFREAHYISEAVACTGRLGSMDLVEVNPKLTEGPESEATAQLGMALIASAMGSRIL